MSSEEQRKLDAYKCSTKRVKHMNIAIHGCKQHEPSITTKFHNIRLRKVTTNRKYFKRTLCKKFFPNLEKGE